MYYDAWIVNNVLMTINNVLKSTLMSIHCYSARSLCAGQGPPASIPPGAGRQSTGALGGTADLSVWETPAPLARVPAGREPRVLHRFGSRQHNVTWRAQLHRAVEKRIAHF